MSSIESALQAMIWWDMRWIFKLLLRHLGSLRLDDWANSVPLLPALRWLCCFGTALCSVVCQPVLAEAASSVPALLTDGTHAGARDDGWTPLGLAMQQEGDTRLGALVLAILVASNDQDYPDCQVEPSSCSLSRLVC